MTWINELRELQEIDFALDSRRASYDDAQSRLGESDEINELRARVGELQSIHRAAQTTQKDVELEADELKSKIAPAEEKLYSGTIRNPKELADLQADIDQLKRHLSSVEDRDLEALGSLETAEREYREASAELAERDEAWQAEQAELRERSAQLESEIATYQSQRDELATSIDRGTLQTYDRVRRAHQGRGIAKLDRNLCTGCRITLPVNMVNRARAGNALVHCPNCERILYA
jgi:predicted  nucleic acid-binding Zn-ribbon protein